MRQWRAHTLVRVCLVVCAALHSNVKVGAAAFKAAEWSVVGVTLQSTKPGATGAATLLAHIRPGWHIYAMQEPENGPMPTAVGLAEGDPVELLSVDEAPALMVMDPVLHRTVGMFQKTAAFTLHFRLSSKVAPGATGHVMVHYQSCNEQVCTPPRTEALPFTLFQAR